MSYEDEIRRQMEQAAAAQQLQPQCPADEDIDGAFSMVREHVPMYKGPAMKATKKGMAAALRKPSRKTRHKEAVAANRQNKAREQHHQKFHGY